MRALAAFVLLAACAAPLSEKEPSPAFLPDAGGLGVAGSALRVDFGRSPKGVIPLMSRALGAPRALPLAGCPAGVVQRLDWSGLELAFTAERFVGWRQGTAVGGTPCAS